MVGERVRHRRPIFLHLRLVRTDAVLDLRSSWREGLVMYVDSPLIGGNVGFWKLSMRFPTEVAAMVGGG